jgi:6-pyruvoyl-tetrahydropterin synthase
LSRFSVIIDRDTLRFSASHWVKYTPTVINETVDGGLAVTQKGLTIVEPLHGHTFRAKLKIDGILDEFGCVVDFVLVEQIMRKILERFEHKILVPVHDPDLVFRNDGNQIKIGVLNREWAFPAKDVKFLASKNASTETIAEIILAEFVVVMQKNNILPYPFSDDQFVLTLEEDTGMYAQVAYRCGM